MARTYSGIREKRPNTPTFTDCAGSSLEISKNYSEKCIKKADRSFSQGLQCQQMNSISALLSMEEAVFVIHSPQGCAGCVNFANDIYRVGQTHRGQSVARNARIFITNLDEKDIIHGGEEKLRQAVRTAESRHHPKMIFIFASCASGIIGDDIDTISADLQTELNAVLIPIHCEGFKSKICASGYDAAFMAISKYILRDEEKGETVPNLLNLFAPTSVSYADQTEIERIMAVIGIEVNYIPFYSSLEKLKMIPNAGGSSAICKVFADEFMKDLKEDYGIPYSHTIMPIGIRNTDRWLLGVAELMGKTAEAKEYMENEHARIQPFVDDLRAHLSGKRVFICGGTGRSFAAAALVEDLGMKLVGLETPTYDDDAQFDIEHLNSVHGDFIIDVANMMPFEQVNLLNKLKPDVFIGQPTWAAQLGIPTTHILDMKRPTMGYNGLLYLGSKMVCQLENPGYNKRLSKHANLPYKQSWYKDNAFKFIQEF
jgi:nitrogenase molybdenum-iron protein alpha chain